MAKQKQDQGKKEGTPQPGKRDRDQRKDNPQQDDPTQGNRQEDFGENAQANEPETPAKKAKPQQQGQRDRNAPDRQDNEDADLDNE